MDRVRLLLAASPPFPLHRVPALSFEFTTLKIDRLSSELNLNTHVVEQDGESILYYLIYKLIAGESLLPRLY